MEKTKVLFLCAINSCRSQMAEGWARHLKSDTIEPYSAGIRSAVVNPDAIKIMAEAGVDISGHTSKTVDDLNEVEFDYVIIVCDVTDSECPTFSGTAKVIRKPFRDPPKLAANAKTESEKMSAFREVRDEIRRYIEDSPFL